MDGVLVDTEARNFELAQEIFARHGGHCTRESFLAGCGLPSMEMWSLLIKASGTAIDPTEVEREFWEQYHAAVEERGLPRFPGLDTCLAQLKAHGLKLAVASGSFRERVRETVEGLGYAPYFDEIVSADECARPKPAPDIFLYAAHALGADPSECLVIEDSQNGMRAASAAHIPFVGFAGSTLAPNMSLAKLVFDNYRETSPEDFAHWHRELTE